jgi:hypothetical protein
MDAMCSSETSVDTQRTTLRYIPEDGILQNHRRDDFKSYNNPESMNRVIFETECCVSFVDKLLPSIVIRTRHLIREEALQYLTATITAVLYHCAQNIVRKEM